ncbi:MAG TPA: MarR family transcriptional regulator [Rhizomicrobium sp.]|jgi:DNA-binding MarR family transcriptional regulator|nr:MarR family transcriptional regulator [Rhizomicrobium sp.]
MSRPANWRENDASATLVSGGPSVHDAAECILFEPDGTPDSFDLLFLLQTVARTLRKQWDRELHTRIAGLNATRASVILELGRSGGASQSHLAGLLGLSPMAMSQLLDDLEHRALILREPVPADRRAWAVRLTDKGQRTLRVVQAIGRAFAEQSCSGMDEEEKLILAHMLVALAHSSAAAFAETPQKSSPGVLGSER